VGQAADRDRMIDLLLGQLDVHLRRDQEARQVSEAERVVREAECLMQERFAAAVVIETVARDVGVSPSSLRAHFARLRGCAPTAYLRYLRVQHALAMLRESSLTLDAIAPLCGCYSASHLSRCVKQETGRSPGSFRLHRE
jgi:transcriptional regulator GlxA family with amidase domain